jgi:hypothetical protein
MQIKQLRVKLAHVATTLKVHQNASRPINMLPPEILVEIFHEVYPLLTRFPPSTEDYPWQDDLVKISHVCSHWRQTALACPSLWSAIHVSGSRARHAPVFLKRSMCTSLRIFLSGGDSSDDYFDLLEAVWALTAHAHRFIECHIDWGAPEKALREPPHSITGSIFIRATCIRYLGRPSAQPSKTRVFTDKRQPIRHALHESHTSLVGLDILRFSNNHVDSRSFTPHTSS